ncbi:MAG TPA: hypothetical protein DCY48_02525 [Candidatus Magasanikbacteria bacterium]|nr:MAG: hypothetical protein A3I74_01440 [Candidatus Magasanikbacteria bacterium RIFCSPLOWO2_02_FULL_47_16]OGH79898.1 MAG: hypothetical protein A3C10_01785 [Candidatus Magasanikbacteria bacterium RIFCSPHIGHO2_02_FULL_48_18]HAZ28628.1 hypothetical protein [Candidatus Magasanikbacteria bacterium]
MKMQIPQSPPQMEPEKVLSAALVRGIIFGVVLAGVVLYIVFSRQMKSIEKDYMMQTVQNETDTP